MKTATTYFQFILANNRGHLIDKGWLYPGERENQQHAFYNLCGTAIPWLTEKAAGTYAAIGEKLVRDLRDISTNRIASSEALATLREPDIAALLEKVGQPDLVVFTIRGLSALIPSAWQQYIKGGGTVLLDPYIRKMKQERLPVDEAKGAWQIYGYGEAIRRWAVAGGVPVHVVIVPSQRGEGSTTWQRFQEAAGLPNIVDTEVPPSEQNISLSSEMAELLRKFNAVCKREELRSDHIAFLKKVVLPTSYKRLGKKIVVPHKFKDMISAWNDEEKEKLSRYATRVFGDLDAL